jgi:UDP-glucuronate decarboxylase
MTGRHALVTGGAGFIGSHLVDALLADDYRVTVLDNYGSGRPENLAHVETDRLAVHDHDVREPYPDVGAIDEVYHFASRADPSGFVDHGVEIALTNSVGTRNALDVARDHDAMTVLASTSEVYGDPEVHPQPETYNGNVNVRGVRGPYDESKRFSEALGKAYERQYGMDVRTVRIFNTYGPRVNPTDGRVVPTFLRQALRGEDITVYGDGEQTRSFCYVTDLVAGIRAFAEADAPVAAGAVVNLGSTDEITINELVERVLAVVEADSRVVHEELPEDDPQVRRPDISRALEMLAWEPCVGLDEGLARTVEDLERTLSG